MNYKVIGMGDGVRLYLPETEEQKPISRKCANCKCWFSEWPNDEPNLVAYFGFYVQICDYCAKEKGTDN
jgi:hypothetical protein